MPRKTFRIAVRQYEPLEAVVPIFWERYRQKTNCKLELQAVAMDLKTLYEAIFDQEGLRRGEWDVAHVNTDWLAGAREQGALLDISSHIAKDPPEDYPHGWPDALLRLQSFDQEVYGFPFHDGPECFIYRKDLFSDEGEKRKFRQRYSRELKVPDTWSDFIQVAQFFNRPAEGMYGTVFAAYPDRHNNVFDFALQVWSRGGDLVRDGRVELDSEQAAEAMQFYRGILNDASAVYPRCRETDSIASGWLFAEGKIAMMVNWFGFAAMCETVDRSKVRGRVGIGSIPRNQGCRPVSLSVYYTWSVAAGSPHRDLAYDFIKFCVNRENDRLLPLKGAIGCRKSTWNDKEINELIPYYSELIGMHEYVRQFPKTPAWHEITEAIDGLVLQVVNTDRPVSEILNEAQQRVADIRIRPE